MELRARADIEAGLAAVEEELQFGDDSFYRGARAAYRWLLGIDRVSPATGYVGQVSDRVIETEERQARAAIYHEPYAPRLDQGFAVGIEHALMWCRQATEHPPVPLSLAA